MSSYSGIVQAAMDRQTGNVALGAVATLTDGGTWILSSDGGQTDSGRPHDLVAVLPAPLFDGTRVLVLRVTVNPDLVRELSEQLDDPSVTVNDSEAQPEPEALAAAHTVSITEHPFPFFATCDCGWTSRRIASSEAAQPLARMHLIEVGIAAGKDAAK